MNKLIEKLMDEITDNTHPHPGGVVCDWLTEFVTFASGRVYRNTFSKEEIIHYFEHAIDVYKDENPDLKYIDMSITTPPDASPSP